MVKIVLIGISAVMLAVNLKSVKAEYSTYIGLAACILISIYGISKMKIMIDMIEQVMGLISSGRQYVMILIKIAGITYISEFSAGICKDAGHAAVASQIEFVSRLTILSMSIPIMTGMIEMIGNSL